MLTSVAVFQIMLNVGFFLSEQHNRRVARQNMSTMRSVGTSNSNAALLPSKPVPARNPTSQVAALTAVTVLIIVLLLLLSVWHITAVMSAKIAMTSDTAESHSYLPSHVLRSTPSPDATYYYATTGDVHNLSYAGGFFSDAALTRPVSTWHDIPLYTNQRAAANIDRDSIPIHFVCEIPRLTRIKFEMNKADSLNRIMPDRDKQTNQLRVNLHGDYQVNYGMLPQTFSDPKLLASGTKFRGDGDPIDALELGSRQMPTGTVAAVKVVGALALIDNDAMDWKILVIRVDDPLADLIHDVADVERHLTGTIQALRAYFQDYKRTTTGLVNQFAFEDAAVPPGALGRVRAVSAVRESHRQWSAAFGK